MMTETCHQFKLIDLSTAEIQNVHHHILNRGRCEPAWTIGGIAMDFFGPCAHSDWPRVRTGHGLPKIRTVRCRGLDIDTDKPWSRSVRGLDTDMFADRSRTWIVRGHGQTVVMIADWTRAWTDHGRGCGLDMDIFADKSRPRTNCGHGHGLDTGLD